MYRIMFDQLKDFLGKPLGLGTSGGFTGGASILAWIKILGEHAAPIGVILGVIVTGYSLYLNLKGRVRAEEKHQLEMRILRKQLGDTDRESE